MLFQVLNLADFGVVVSDGLIGNITSLARILNSADVLFDLGVARVEAGDHKAKTVATKTLPDQARKLGVSIRNVGALVLVLLLVVQGRDYLPEREQTLVDVDALLVGGVARLALSLTPSQVYQLQLAHNHIVDI